MTQTPEQRQQNRVAPKSTTMSLFRLSITLPRSHTQSHIKGKRHVPQFDLSSKNTIHHLNTHQYIQKRNIGSTITGPVATVFGSTGFLGPYVVEALARRGIQVVVPYRGEEKYINPVKPLGEVGQIVPLFYDVRDQSSVERAVSHSNIVVNLIGRDFETRNFNWNAANVESAKTIARASKKLGVERLVHLSCIGADPYADSFFAQAKGRAEKEVLDIFPEATIVRPTHMFGPQDRFLNKYGKLCYYSKFVPCLVNKNTRVQPVWVNDVASGIDRILAATETEGKIFELGGPLVYTIEEIIIGCLDALERGNSGYFTGGVIQIPDQFALPLARFLQNSRQPLWLEDEVRYHRTDLVVSPKASHTFRQLGIEPSRLENIGYLLLQRFKVPSRLLKE